MKAAGAGSRFDDRAVRSALFYVFVLGLYLSLRGYHSFDGDQAYRLPLLLHRQDPGLFGDDPFVRSFDQFNPHRGALAILDAVSRPLGLPLALFLIFVAVFLGTCRAVERLATASWPRAGDGVGRVAIGLFLLAKAGNIGTNHLFEAMVLDRLAALALGWQAIAVAIVKPEVGWRTGAVWIALATLVHPSIGLQLAMVLAASWIAWTLAGGGGAVRPSTAIRGLVSLGLAVAPGLAVNLAQGSNLRGDLPDRLFWILSVELQNPQHMLPHLWRMPQWLSWFSYLAVAALTVAAAKPESDPPPDSAAPRRRLEIMIVVLMAGLGMAWYAIERQHNIRATVFQPFRMSTVVRGLALVLISGRIATLWRAGGGLNGIRVAVLATGLLGDWLFVVAALGEIAVSTVEWIAGRWAPRRLARVAPALTYTIVMALGWRFLSLHDTESGHIPLTIAAVAGWSAGLALRRGVLIPRLCGGTEGRRRRRLAAAVVAAWSLPVAAMAASLIPWQSSASRLELVRGLVQRCRFYPMPLDDIERLALWCRDRTPASARFIGPPGPKTFRLWSRRSVAFNRSCSPYDGAGLSDWFARFSDHVAFSGTPEEFVRAYRDHRHEFEARYDALSDAQYAELALRQGARFVIARAPKAGKERPSKPLEMLHAEGQYAVYRVNGSAVVHRHP